MHVLVVGGAGYLGSTLTSALLRRGHSVRIIGRSLIDPRIFGDYPKLEFVQGNILALNAAWFTDIDALVHLAGVGSGPVAQADPLRAQRENVDASRAIAEAAVRHGVRTAIYASSTSVYEAAPVCGDDEFSRLQPAVLTTYARTKLEGEAAFRDGCADQLASYCIRIGGLYGFGRITRYDLLVNALVRFAVLNQHLYLHNGGGAWRPVISVGDAAQAVCIILEQARSSGSETFDIVTENVRISEIAHIIIAAGAERGLPVELTLQSVDREITSYRANTKALAARYSAFTAHESVRGVIGDMLDRFLQTDFDREHLATYSYTEWNRAHAHS